MTHVPKIGADFRPGVSSALESLKSRRAPPTLFGGGDKVGGGRLIGLRVGEISDRVSLDEGRRHGPSRPRPRLLGQQIARIVDRAQVAATSLLLLSAKMPIRRR